MRAALLLPLAALAACAAPARVPERRAAPMMGELDARTAPAPAPASARVPEPEPSPAQPIPGARRETVEFDEVGSGRALSHESQDAAVARAREDALAKAMRGAADVFYGFSDFSAEIGGQQHETVSRFLFSSNQGVLTELSSGVPECESKDGVTSCQLRVRGSIAFRGGIDPSFVVLDKHSGRRLGLERLRYFHDEPVHLTLASTRDAYLYAFSWDENDEVYMIFPNRYRRGNRLRAGDVLEVPEPEGGVNYRATLPAGKTSSNERLLIIASLREFITPLAVSPDSGPASHKIGSLSDLMRRLAQLERREWTLHVVPYEIVSRSVVR